MVLSVFGSILQPVFGFLGDRHNRKLFVVMGVLCSAIFMGSICFAPNFIILVFMLIFGSSGVASFHPNGAASIGELSSGRSTFVMSVFLMSGCIGLAGAPIVITSIVSLYGINMLCLTALPGIVLVVILIKFLPGISRSDEKANLSGLRILFLKSAWPLWVLFIIMFFRSIVITSFMSFMSILCVEKGQSLRESGVAISIFLISGTVGGLIGGYFADYINRKIVIAASSILACPLLLWFLNENAVFSMILLSLSGIVIFAAAPVNVLIVQGLYPEMASAVSGIAMGFVWGTAGLVLPIVGNIADHYSMGTSLEIVAFLAPIAGLLVFMLPNINNPTLQLSNKD